MSMFARVRTAALSGIDAIPVDVEVRTRHGTPSFTIIGLGDSAIRESRDRVLSAMRHLGFFLPDKILVNLAPAELRKEGSAFDVPMALGILAASGQLDTRGCLSKSFHGELSLDGKVKPVRGVLALVIGALSNKFTEVVVPFDNREEASLIQGIKVIPVSSLIQLLQYLKGEQPISPLEYPPYEETGLHFRRNIHEVKGQDSAKRALLIAAAGGHNLLMVGPPGCGKSMLAERFPSLLPPLGQEEIQEVVKIHSVAAVPFGHILQGERPFRSPHHVVSEVGLVGGGSIPKPGEISLAHRGVLFLDEFPEFQRATIEALRAPLETGKITVTRAKHSSTFPAAFQLLAAMNPCPCGRSGINPKESKNSCLCSPNAIETYLRRLSQPILDRIDIKIELEAVPLSLMIERSESMKDSEQENLKLLVERTRGRQHKRTRKLNSLLSLHELQTLIKVEVNALQLLERSSEKLNLSARSFVKMLRVGLTIADLAEASSVTTSHMAEALRFRGQLGPGF